MVKKKAACAVCKCLDKVPSSHNGVKDARKKNSQMVHSGSTGLNVIAEILQG